MEKKKVTTKGTMQEMEQYTELDERTIEEAIQKVEEAAHIEVEVPDKDES